ncbi:MAG: alanine--tRNA ligase [Candidatus Micrarchaeia archaeon]
MTKIPTTKQELKKKFSEEYEKHYALEFFREKGFERKKCPKCGRNFWSLGKETCGDSSCEPYSFFGKRDADYIEVWRGFEKFFVGHGHESIPRYPVICRWRDDLYFTIASIVDFMRLEQGAVVFEYPANPLVVPQMCLRFNDIPNVGVTGRHFSCFIMAGQHSFNYPADGYWKDRCIELNFEYLTKVLGIGEDELTYVEDIWAMPDLSSFGPCLETFSKGLEIVNSVFTEFRKVGDRIEELESKVIDVGWGFERIVWYAAGTPTAYDCAFGPVVEKLIKTSGVEYDRHVFNEYARVCGSLDLSETKNPKMARELIAQKLRLSVSELEKKIAPVEAIYAIADHSRALAFAIADGGLPSNVGGGYNLRVILRRALGFIRDYGLSFSLNDVIHMHADYLKPLFPEIYENLAEISEIIEVEEKRYANTLEKSRRIVSERLAKKKRIEEDEMVLLYESHGITPELVSEVAREKNMEVELPYDFYNRLTQKHVFAEEKAEGGYEVADLSETKLLYYDYLTECDAKIIDVQNDAIVLDKTVFYPTGGGQDNDTGFVEHNGKRIRVLDVQKVGGVIFHKLEKIGDLKKGDFVHCHVDINRRMALMRHHAATHLLNAVCRNMLGKHVWQAGAKKTVEKAHLDITHYEKLSDEQVSAIERRVNELILEDHPISSEWLERGEAERKYGFRLYQGGGSPGKKVRVTKIGKEGEIDVEACGGLYVSSTAKIGMFKIIRDERIQDGVVRLEFCAGDKAVEFIQQREKLLARASSNLSVSPEQLPDATARFFREWKEKDKKIEEMTKLIALAEVRELEKKGGNVARTAIDYDIEIMQQICLAYAEKNENARVLFVNKRNEFVIGAGEKHPMKANEIASALLKKFGGKGGGNKKFARGKFEKTQGIEKAFEELTNG